MWYGTHTHAHACARAHTHTRARTQFTTTRKRVTYRWPRRIDQSLFVLQIECIPETRQFGDLVLSYYIPPIVHSSHDVRSSLSLIALAVRLHRLRAALARRGATRCDERVAVLKYTLGTRRH